MSSSVPDPRNARGGTGVLPPNPEQWDCEHNGLDLRRDLSVATDTRLSVDDAFRLIPDTVLLPHGELAVAKVHADHFRASANWSGFAMELPGGPNLVVFNDSHPETRVRATVMEEFFHLRLRHPRSVIRSLGDGSHQRTIDDAIERIAYGSGAAALLPYCELKRLITAGRTHAEIARTFGVSTGLVSYRSKVTRLFRRSSRTRKRAT
jgi:Zn-dependent peptidase ImmA (M78 family)